MFGKEPSKIKCNETGMIFENQVRAAEWLYENGYTVAQLENIRTRLCRMVNDTKYMVSKTNGKDYPSWGNVRTIYGYTFKKI